ncbi:hypothetical protein CASFOL_025394 [Castilleja foliolosa]|uniref:Eukaryotic translation initiation factor 5B n=1 Tax=Castilleja foliolosa TaxID=1961234 RepID=A0ABD3CUR2_9LAMI
MGRKKPTSRDDESGPAGYFAGGKLKKKALVIADDEYSNGTESFEDVLIQEHLAPVGNKEKAKDDDAMDNEAVEEGDVDAPAIKLYAAKKKKSKGKRIGTNSVFTSSTFGLLVEDEERDDNEKEDIEDEDDVSGEPVIAFSGKKKPSKSKKCGGGFSSAFDLLDEEEESNDKDERSKEEEDIGIIFTVTEKSLKNLNEASGNSISAVRLNEENAEDVSISKTKFSKVGNGDESSDFIELTQHIHESNTRKQTNEDVAETSTKKKKKGRKAGQEEDDLDKILAELGAIPPEPKEVPTSVEIPPEENVKNQLEVEEEKDRPVESASAKKKKKKKEKEKEKKAAAAEEKLKEIETEASNKLAGKKVRKHVREMQEKLALLKELEEKKKREEEEKHQKEEEERIAKEEEKRIAEEKHRLKKEKEKEKLLKKKLSGKLLTRKQKERNLRMEAMRMQILGNVGMQLPVGESAGAPAKRPRYQKKNLKPHTQSNGAVALDSGEGTESKENQQEIVLEHFAPEGESVEDVVSSSAKNKNDVTDVVQENGVDEDDEEWDAKSWDEADLKFPGKSEFADEVDSEPEPLVRKEIKSARAATQDVELPSVATKTVEKVASVMPQRFENVDGKKKNSNAEDSDKNYTTSVVNCEKNRNEQKSDDHPALNGLNLRSPICCIMGHVDTGKTKLLDCIRGTNVQEGEAGGITQQIGATYFPADNIRERTRELKPDARLNVPGLLVIDTPGHESFTNLRSRGSMLCDVAVLVVDIMHGLEKQTIESLNLLKNGNTDFIVALNKVDKIFGWKTCRNAPIKKALSRQNSDVKMRFNDGLKKVKNQLQEQGLNAELYYKNKEIWETCNIVPTSAKSYIDVMENSGEGIPDLLLLLVQWTQKTMIESLTYSDKVQCTILEVKVVEGHGTTIDVVLVNGVLHEGDQIVVCGLQGPIVTSIRALLTPHPMKELRVKGTYLHHKEIKAAMCIKITAQGLEHTITGTSLYVVGPHDDLEKIKEACIDMKSVMSRIDVSAEGVCVQASTQGSLEALLEFLKTPAVDIPVSYTSIGPVHKKDVKKAGVMLEKKKEYGTILAFDVKVTQEARELADELGVKIFIADIIYHLFDKFKAYIDNLKEEKKKEAADEAVFPCVLMPNCVFNKKDPIVLGVDVLEGIAKIGTPLCVPQRGFIEIGRIASIENDHKPVDYAKKGQKVAIKIIANNPDEQQKMFGRHFEMEDELVSKITRNSLDALEENYADELSRDTKRLLLNLGKLFKILRVRKK